MRISDWSSDVFSSDLPPGAASWSANPRRFHAPAPAWVLPHPPGMRLARPPRRPLPSCFFLLKFLRPILYITTGGGMSFPPCGARLRSLESGPCSVDIKRSEEHTSELQSLMRNSYAVFCLKKKTKNKI